VTPDLRDAVSFICGIAASASFLLDCRLRRIAMAKPPRTKKAPTTAPTLIPAFAPALNPLVSALGLAAAVCPLVVAAVAVAAAAVEVALVLARVKSLTVTLKQGGFSVNAEAWTNVYGSC
jgi:hypothetical protein